MTKLNHQRQNLYQRARESEYRYPDRIQRSTPYNYFWLPIPFRRHRGITLPELIFVDPSFFYWARGKLYGELGSQAAMVALRAAHLLPPASRRKSQFCLLRDDSGRLKRITLVRKAQLAGCGSEDHFFTPHLDLEVFRQFESGTAAARKIVRFVKEIYFDDEDAELTALRCQEFFDNLRHFDVECGDDHSLLD